MLASAAWLEQIARRARRRCGPRTATARPRGRADGCACAAQRPSIFDFYEQNIGLLTPLLAEQLAEAERRYPAEWIEAAFTEAVNHNKRNWSYIRRILRIWAAGGTAWQRESGCGRATSCRTSRSRQIPPGQICPPLPTRMRPAARLCLGAGYLRMEVPVGHPNFGRLFPCQCKLTRDGRAARMSTWSAGATWTPSPIRPSTTSTRTIPGTRDAFLAARRVCAQPERLAATCWATTAAARPTWRRPSPTRRSSRGLHTYFAIAPDLLDYLRAAYDPDGAGSYDERFEAIRTVPLLIVDDLGTENTTALGARKALPDLQPPL